MGLDLVQAERLQCTTISTHEARALERGCAYPLRLRDRHASGDVRLVQKHQQAGTHQALYGLVITASPLLSKGP